MMSEPVLKVEGLRKSFTVNRRTVHALNGVSLVLHRGETLGIIGESGSGKSTLGRIAVGLDTPTAGELHIEGMRIDTLPPPVRREKQRQCQMIFQDPYSSLNPRLTVGRQIGEGLFARGERDWPVIKTTVADLLERVGLKREFAKRYPHEFSGGQRQRIAVARALAPSPQIVVADEPVSALDVSIQAQILDLLADLKKDGNLSYLFISHDMAVVARLCDRIAVMHRGRIVECGPVRAVIENPQHPYTRNLLDAVPRFGRRRTGQKPVPVHLPQHGDDDTFVTVAEGHTVLQAAGGF
ncbi:ATP-binding cassette domain-containing protein [Phyllobacterium endophyticum]|uniref:ABC transporter ATP-binding protein n=1 Tax=Phyllobacterium endophyticum TaxID=1149773 RepID=A0A2P7ARL2_9HYPH|nr:ATP-binding cassette domain-containing protein [Phyllobacterium endophyticum]MBB3237480.1 peptide/nickel transport system ATP-binding protein [Phyllobacterium endophyticum]PSH56803.1 ABC transporter ATP-binding protein [Phyllobacterium endophyticum]TYR44213.1 ABC transporter ATP-binding protein [Phyllobacterium endophyticum]